MFFLIRIRGAKWVVELKCITVASMLVLPGNGLGVFHTHLYRQNAFVFEEKENYCFINSFYNYHWSSPSSGYKSKKKEFGYFRVVKY